MVAGVNQRYHLQVDLLDAFVSNRQIHFGSGPNITVALLKNLKYSKFNELISIVIYFGFLFSLDDSVGNSRRYCLWISQILAQFRVWLHPNCQLDSLPGQAFVSLRISEVTETSAESICRRKLLLIVNISNQVSKKIP